MSAIAAELDAIAFASSASLAPRAALSSLAVWVPVTAFSFNCVFNLAAASIEVFAISAASLEVSCCSPKIELNWFAAERPALAPLAIADALLLLIASKAVNWLAEMFWANWFWACSFSSLVCL